MADRLLRILPPALALAVLVPGCASLLPSGWKAEDELPDPKGELNFGDVERVVGSYVVVAGTGNVVIEGVGLVTGLDNTGGDVPPSAYRRNIKEDMKRRRVPNPDQLLRSPKTAVVLLRAFVPPLHRKGDPLDIEVSLPPKSEATSLRGGFLLASSLFESRALASGTSLKGRQLAVCEGPILLSPAEDRDIKGDALLRKGSIPGGGRYVGDDLSLTLQLRTDYSSARMTERIADHIGDRFHGFDAYGIQKPMAEAKTDKRIVLDIPDAYVDHPSRYVKVVKRIHLTETPLEARLRMEALREDLLDPATSEAAAIELEAIGRDAKPILKEALKSEELICRFQAAVALAYLGDESGTTHLAEAARTQPALRVWALAAMSTLDGGEAISDLQSLLSEESIETRYGAVRAITTVDPGHPVVAGRKLNDGCVMRLIESTAEPVVHLTKSQKSEITLFGRDQEFTLPLAVRAGNKLLITGRPGTGTVKVSRFSPGEADQQRTVSPRVADVLDACAKLGASYPDLVGLLLEAEAQHNMPGVIAIDALPEGGRRYVAEADRPDDAGDEAAPETPNAAAQYAAADEFAAEPDVILDEGTATGGLFDDLKSDDPPPKAADASPAPQPAAASRPPSQGEPTVR